MIITTTNKGIHYAPLSGVVCQFADIFDLSMPIRNIKTNFMETIRKKTKLDWEHMCGFSVKTQSTA